MEIIYDKSIFEKYFSVIKDNFKRNEITEIIIHGTGGFNTARGLMNWILDGEREKEYKKGIALFHYLIDRAGIIYKIIPTEYWCYHSSSGAHDRYTIGIELLNPDKNNKAKYELEQYNSLFDMIKTIIKNHKIEIIAGHGITKKQAGTAYKECPGNFDWSMLENNFNVIKIEDEMYKII